MTTRRSFLKTGGVFLASPGLVQAASLDFVPRHRYYAMMDKGTGYYDIVREDGYGIGWLSRDEILSLPACNKNSLLQAAAEGITDANRKLIQANAVAELHAETLPLNALSYLT